LRECTTTNPQAWQAVVDYVEDEVVEIFFSSCQRSSGYSLSRLLM
jgi:hypothetical protein